MTSRPMSSRRPCRPSSTSRSPSARCARFFSSQRAEIAAALEAELRARLASDGILLKGVQIGSVDLPPDYRQGMDSLLADSLASERMRYTLEIADKKVKETELHAAADKVKRETAAEAAGREQIIAAKAQEEAMRPCAALHAEADRAARAGSAGRQRRARQAGRRCGPGAPHRDSR